MTDANNAFAKVIAKAWGDEAFRAQLLADPTAALAAEGVNAPAGKKFAIAEDTDDVVFDTLVSNQGKGRAVGTPDSPAARLMLPGPHFGNITD